MNLLNFFWIALGGALGSLLRFSFNFILPFTPNSFPKATFVINVLASLFLGIISGLLLNKFQDHSWLKYF
jgi:CrcB protein